MFRDRTSQGVNPNPRQFTSLYSTPAYLDSYSYAIYNPPYGPNLAYTLDRYAQLTRENQMTETPEPTVLQQYRYLAAIGTRDALRARVAHLAEIQDSRARQRLSHAHTLDDDNMYH